MTRGTFAIITSDAVITSPEFNGDMYPSGNGRQAVQELKKVGDMADFLYAIAKFNKEHHHYNDIDKLTYVESLDWLDFTTAYFDKWFSDYVYIKNISQGDVTLTCGNGRFILRHGQIARINFGDLEKIFDSAAKA